MNKLVVIGNLGADAEVKVENGKKFVSLSIADTKRRQRQDGTFEEKVQWISATINGDGGNLLQYLIKGAKVYAYGEMQLNMYHSEKQRALVAGCKIFVRDIELISTNVDAVPRELYDKDGQAHYVGKYFFAPTLKNGELYDRHGQCYSVKDGWVSQPSDAVEANAEDSTENEQDTKSENNKK